MSNNKNNKPSTQKTPDKFIVSAYINKETAEKAKGVQKKTNVIKSKKMSVSSKSWLLRQMNDPFAKQAKDMGYRSRACFKILEINTKYKIIKQAKSILDLGCAPGGWSQICKNLNPQAKIVACDLLAIDSLSGVDFLQGDFTDENIQNQITAILPTIDLIISDIAPNTTGNFETDHIRIMAICEQVIEFAKKFLTPDGSLVMKIFMGSEEKSLIESLKTIFSKTSYFKPKSSRVESKEIYLACVGFRREASVVI